MPVQWSTGSELKSDRPAIREELRRSCTGAAMLRETRVRATREVYIVFVGTVSRVWFFGLSLEWVSRECVSSQARTGVLSEDR
jgi:hypothetical protein